MVIPLIIGHFAGSRAKPAEGLIGSFNPDT